MREDALAAEALRQVRHDGVAQLRSGFRRDPVRVLAVAADHRTGAGDGAVGTFGGIAAGGDLREEVRQQGRAVLQSGRVEVVGLERRDDGEATAGPRDRGRQQTLAARLRQRPEGGDDAAVAGATVAQRQDDRVAVHALDLLAVRDDERFLLRILEEGGDVRVLADRLLDRRRDPLRVPRGDGDDGQRLAGTGARVPDDQVDDAIDLDVQALDLARRGVRRPQRVRDVRELQSAAVAGEGGGDGRDVAVVEVAVRQLHQFQRRHPVAGVEAVAGQELREVLPHTHHRRFRRQGAAVDGDTELAGAGQPHVAQGDDLLGAGQGGQDLGGREAAGVREDDGVEQRRVREETRHLERRDRPDGRQGRHDVRGAAGQVRDARTIGAQGVAHGLGLLALLRDDALPAAGVAVAQS